MGFKYSAGQLVEVTQSEVGNTGKRFMVSLMEIAKHELSEGKEVPCYEADFLDASGEGMSWQMENCLKLVNPDGDESSEFTFEELVLNLKQGVTV